MPANSKSPKKFTYSVLFLNLKLSKLCQDEILYLLPLLTKNEIFSFTELLLWKVKEIDIHMNHIFGVLGFSQQTNSFEKKFKGDIKFYTFLEIMN